MTATNKIVKVQRYVPQNLAEARMEQERIQNVLLLLENIFEREEATAKIILDCLYDVGSVNLINQKVPLSFLRGMLKSIARLSKPAFRVIALRWFKKNCPRLITEWLHSLVVFNPTK